MDNALSAAYAGKKITTPQQLNPALATPAESALTNTGRLNSNQKGSISVDAAVADYSYNPTGQTHTGPMGGQSVKTGYTDANGRDILQRVGADGKVQSSYYVIENGKQVTVKSPAFIVQEVVKGSLKRPGLRVETERSVYSGYSKLANGSYRHNITREVVKPPIHIGHAYGWENRRLLKAAEELGMTQKQLNDYVNDPARTQKLFRLENAQDNMSHRNELLGNDRLGIIKDDMRKFLNGK